MNFMIIKEIQKEEIMMRSGKFIKKSFLTSAGKVFAIATVLTAFILGIPGLSFAVEPIKIGHLRDDTGVIAIYGLGHKKAATAAIKRINKAGGIAGRPVEYYPEDTGANPKTAVEKFRRLVFKKKVDFIMGSDMSSACVATNPLAKQLNTVIYQEGFADNIAVKGNRWVFVMPSVTTAESKALVENVWAKTKSRKWASICWDYAWGNDMADGFKRWLEAKGGTFVGKIAVPLGTTDMSRYVPKIPRDADGVALFLFGAGSFNAMKEINKRRPDLEVCGRSVFGAVDIRTMGDYVNGVRIVNLSVREQGDVPDEYKAYVKAYREAIGVDDWGRDVKTNKEIMYQVSYMSWEIPYFFKQAVEASGWKTKKDNLKLIKALEGLKVPASYEHPQGPKWIRPEDHLTFQPAYCSMIKDKRPRLQQVVPLEKMIFTPVLNNYLK